MKRDISHARRLIQLSQSNPLLQKQISTLARLPPKEAAISAVRIGRLNGLYFSENDWLSLSPPQSSLQKKSVAHGFKR